MCVCVCVCVCVCEREREREREVGERKGERVAGMGGKRKRRGRCDHTKCKRGKELETGGWLEKGQVWVVRKGTGVGG